MQTQGEEGIGSTADTTTGEDDMVWTDRQRKKRQRKPTERGEEATRTGGGEKKATGDGQRSGTTKYKGRTKGKNRKRRSGKGKGRNLGKRSQQGRLPQGHGVRPPEK